MDRSTRRIAVTAMLVAATVVVVGGAIFLGGSPASGGGGETATPPPTGTVYTRAPSAGGSTGSGDDTDVPPFTFTIDSIEECGQTCRDVTATLDNEQNTTATNVTVFTRIYAGNSTDESDRVWTGEEAVGTMEPGSSATRTQRVELSATEGFEVTRNDGWITIVTTVTSDETTITFESRQKVA